MLHMACELESLEVDNLEESRSSRTEQLKDIVGVIHSMEEDQRFGLGEGAGRCGMHGHHARSRAKRAGHTIFECQAGAGPG